MNPVSLLTAFVVAVAFYVSFVIMDDATLLQQSLVFSMSIFVYLVIFYRKGMSKTMQTAGHRFSQAYAQAPVNGGGVGMTTAPGTYSQPGGITDELRVINRWLVKRNIPVQASGCVPTPDYECYNLVKTQSASWSVLSEKVLSDLASAIFEHRGNDGDKVNIVFNEQPAFLRVTAKERKVLPWNARLKGLAAHVGQVGATLNGTTLRPVKVNLADQKECMVAVFSSSGGGKSNVLKTLALSAIENADPATTEVYMIDLDSDQFDSWIALPHVRFVAKTEAEALWLLEHLKGTLDSRSVNQDIRRILIVDELQMLTAQSDYADDFVGYLAPLAERWRKRGGNLLLSTQDPTGKNFPTPLQRNMKVVLAGLTEDASYLRDYFGVKGADKLRGDGDFLIKGAGQQVNFKAFLLTNEDVSQTIDAIVSRWGKGGDKLTFDCSNEGFADETDLPPSVRPKRSQVELDAEIIAGHLDEAYDFEAGKLKKGYGVKLLEILYGEPKDNAGNYKKRLDSAVEFALTNLTNRES